MLSSHGSCVFASNGPQALIQYEKAWKADLPFHLACLDILMPELDGHAVLAAIRAHEQVHHVPVSRATRVIMISALNDGSTVLKAFRNQCEAYLVKPFDQDELEDRIRRLGLIGPPHNATTKILRRKK
jgi:two-component system, chemotaxis family, chemotaxis protein CheY